MKTMDITVQVPPGRVVTVKLPDDVEPGAHRLRVTIDDPSPAVHETRLVDPAGLWAGSGKDITREEIDEARREMWRKWAPEAP